MKHWFVIQTLGGQEEFADKQLQRRGRETFYPRAEKTRLHARRRETVLRPLYPTYLFVRFDPFNLSWGEILHVPGVFTIIGITKPMGRPKSLADLTGTNWTPYTGQPRPVPDGIVERLMDWLKDMGGVMPEPTEVEGPMLEPGTRVKFISGALAEIGAEGLVDVHVGNRVRVLLDFMGQSVPTIAPRESLAAVVSP